jgi:YidC/Oxa1 family membrane protein insertase
LWQTFVQYFADVINLLYALTDKLGVPNYGLAIILMTIAIKLILFPLTQKQMKSMRAMQNIQPKAKWIQEKYKDDAQMMQQKTMELYKEHGVNPMGGCLPLLIQMPIFIAFYQSLYKFNYLDGANVGFLWIPDISKPDPFFILAILAAVTTFLQQKISMVQVQGNDPTQKVMLYFMPVMMAWISYKMPAGLPLYWVVFNILGILQQLYVNKTQGNVKMATGTGLDVDIPNKLSEADSHDNKVKEAAVRKDEGGRVQNASPNNRKKRKKR